METIQRQALQTIAEYEMILPGQRVAVACSGGADSTALLLLLEELSSVLGCVVSVAHFNHQLRGSESEADERFVRELAERRSLEFLGGSANVSGQARAARANREAKARELRYEFFRSLLDSSRAERVAVAQTADDQAETVLFRFLRGAGTRGLAGIYPVLDGGIIRPLIAVRRHELREWLRQRGEPWREDLSNADLRLRRNLLRHAVLPSLEKINPQLVETLAHTAELSREEEAFWKEYLPPLLKRCVQQEPGRVRIDLSQLQALPKAAAYRLLRWAAAQVAGTGQSGAARLGEAGNFAQIKSLYSWSISRASSPPNPLRLSLPRNVSLRREFEYLIMERNVPEDTLRQVAKTYSHSVTAPSVVNVPEAGVAYSFDFVDLLRAPADYNKEDITLLDRNLVESPLVLRNWRPGDAYCPAGHSKPRKLKELFQRHRVPSRLRPSWPVLAADSQIVWARGMAVAEGFAPRPGSSQALGIRERPLAGGAII